MNEIRPYYFVGIGGSGMAPLAEALLKQGKQVAGSDTQQTAATRRLADLGATIYQGHQSSQVPNQSILVHSSAISSENPELSYAEQNKLPVWHRSDLLNNLMQDRRSITVAGTHGKTTTSAMVTWILDQLDQDPSSIIGGTFCNAETSSLVGKGNLFVAEADESDGSFLKYQPDIAVITNIDVDHLDFYKDFQGIQDAFLTHAQHIKSDGWVIVNHDDPGSQQLLAQGKRIKTFGFIQSSDLWADIDSLRIIDGKTSIQLHHHGAPATCILPTIGHHNIQNALAAISAALCVDLDLSDCCRALESFPGTNRRLNQISSSSKAVVFDDYAHNPGKITAVVKALKEAWPAHHLHVIFQPHRYTRTQSLWDEFSRSFEMADSACITSIYSASEEPICGVNSAILARSIQKVSGVPTTTCNDLKNLSDMTAQYATTVSRPFLCLTVGAGNLFQYSSTISNAVQNELK